MMAIPQLPPAETIEDALADLAGAVQAVVQLEIEDHRGQPHSRGFLLLAAALQQWQATGFAVDDANEVANDTLTVFRSV